MDDACQVCGEYHETDEESCEQPHFTNVPTEEESAAQWTYIELPDGTLRHVHIASGLSY